MQRLLMLVLVVSVAQESRPAPSIDSKPRPQVIAYEMQTNNMPNSYQFHYETSEGESRTEKGEILEAGTPQEALDVHGSVRWYDTKGNLYEMTYKAGKRGYRTVIKKIN